MPSMFAMQSLDLSEVLKSLQRILKRFRGESLPFKHSGEKALPKILAHPSMIRWALLNLCVYAHRTMPRCADLVLNTTLVNTPTLSPDTSEDGYERCIRIDLVGTKPTEDNTQPLMPKASIPIRNDATLRLATAYGIIHEHHGWIEAETMDGAGLMIRVFLPCTPESEASVSRDRNSILVVDDEADLRILIARYLEKSGYHVLQAGCSREAEEVWQEHHGEIELLFTDMYMPRGKSGIDLAKQLRAEKETLKVIVASGYLLEKEVEEASTRCPFSLLAKPFDLKTLGDQVRASLDAW